MIPSFSSAFCLEGYSELFCFIHWAQVNFTKSCMIPKNMTGERSLKLASNFGCSLGSLPFTYLGLPLGTTKPKIVDFSPFTDRIERRLTVSSAFLSYGGRLTLVNSVLSSFPTYYILPPFHNVSHSRIFHINNDINESI